jgi:signal transduction histidine kinase
LSLAREIHERVMQRLFGVSLVLAASSPLDARGRARAASEMEEALADLRAVLERPLSRTTLTTLRAEISRASSAFPLDVSWEEGVEVPPELEAVTQSVLLEALRNVRKHAVARRVLVRVAQADGALVLEVRNDGRSREGAPGAGMGLRLAGFEALQHGGFLEFGPVAEDGWRVRLVVPR